jgi:hypothetical protein
MLAPPPKQQIPSPMIDLTQDETEDCVMSATAETATRQQKGGRVSAYRSAKQACHCVFSDGTAVGAKVILSNSTLNPGRPYYTCGHIEKNGNGDFNNFRCCTSAKRWICWVPEERVAKETVFAPKGVKFRISVATLSLNKKSRLYPVVAVLSRQRGI